MKTFLHQLPVCTKFTMDMEGMLYMFKITAHKGPQPFTECMMIEAPKGVTISKITFANDREYEIEIIKEPDVSVLD